MDGWTSARASDRPASHESFTKSHPIYLNSEMQLMSLINLEKNCLIWKKTGMFEICKDSYHMHLVGKPK